MRSRSRSVDCTVLVFSATLLTACGGGDGKTNAGAPSSARIVSAAPRKTPEPRRVLAARVLQHTPDGERFDIYFGCVPPSGWSQLPAGADPLSPGVIFRSENGTTVVNAEFVEDRTDHYKRQADVDEEMEERIRRILVGGLSARIDRQHLESAGSLRSHAELTLVDAEGRPTGLPRPRSFSDGAKVVVIDLRIIARTLVGGYITSDSLTNPDCVAAKAFLETITLSPSRPRPTPFAPFVLSESAQAAAAAAERQEKETLARQQAELKAKVEETRKQADEAVALWKLGQSDPQEAQRVIRERNVRACDEGDLAGCQALAGDYARRFEFAEAKRILLIERAHLDELARHPDTLDRKYQGNNTSVNKATIIGFMIQDNDRAMERVNRFLAMSPQQIASMREPDSDNIRRCDQDGSWFSCMQVAQVFRAQGRLSETKAFLLKEKVAIESHRDGAPPSERERMDSALKNVNAELATLAKY